MDSKKIEEISKLFHDMDKYCDIITNCKTFYRQEVPTERKINMKKHNEDYEGIQITLEVINNGFIICNNNCNITGWKKLQFSNFDDLVNKLAFNLGLLEIGEKINLVVIDE